MATDTGGNAMIEDSYTTPVLAAITGREVLRKESRYHPTVRKLDCLPQDPKR